MCGKSPLPFHSERAYAHSYEMIQLNMAAKDLDQGIFIWVKMSGLNTSKETGKTLPFNLRLYVVKLVSAFYEEIRKFYNSRQNLQTSNSLASCNWISKAWDFQRTCRNFRGDGHLIGSELLTLLYS